MNIYLRNLFVYFENVLHPAGGEAENGASKTKRKNKKNASSLIASPESFNIRGIVKKQDKIRRNPAP